MKKDKVKKIPTHLNLRIDSELAEKLMLLSQINWPNVIRNHLNEKADEFMKLGLK
ncbi:hypothetical protein [Flavobacterium sp.]|jgi:hypothetical protein|uniref:hypothetical protein n=1 Tax=Flavobacterium sp. TaxID=239 RepID=UPI0037C14D6E